MGFTATEHVDKLEFDFTKLGPEDDDGKPTDIPGLEGCKGVTPEPSAPQVRRMKKMVRDIFLKQEADALAELKVARENEKAQESGGDMVARIKAMSEEDYERADAEWVAAIAEITSGRPSAEQIALLPGRVQQHFVAYMYEKFANPQSASDDSKPSLAAVKSA